MCLYVELVFTMTILGDINIWIQYYRQLQEVNEDRNLNCHNRLQVEV